MGLSAGDIPAKAAQERVGDWATAARGEVSWKVKRGNATLSDVEQGDDRIAFTVKVTNAKGKEVYSERHVIINPPIYHPDGGVDADGKPTYAVNIRAILRGIVEEHVR